MTDKELSDVEEGKTVKLKCIQCGEGLKQRLSSFGIYDGSKVKVMKNDTRGPVVLKVMNSRVVLGRGQAEKISAEEIDHS